MPRKFKNNTNNFYTEVSTKKRLNRIFREVRSIQDEVDKEKRKAKTKFTKPNRKKR